jgi:hydrogenase maturation protein HypF
VIEIAAASFPQASTQTDMKKTASQRTRLKAAVRGAVQGVGFRPFVFRLATELRLKGWVNNSAQGLFFEVEGRRPELEKFLLRVEAEKPPHSCIQSLEASWLDPVGYAGFEIRDSDAGGSPTALVLPDIATCPECLRDIFDPKNRRHFYPFTNCTRCGPRFSIVESLPYDRANTAMKRFAMCRRCRREYDDPRDRRFHAQPNACPDCGPELELWRHGDASRLAQGPASGKPSRRNREALVAAAEAIRAGSIVAIKGLGGFHLMVAAHHDRAVRRLRALKHREEKPFALMFPSLEAIRAACLVSPLEERLLRSPEAPIVLLKQRGRSQQQVAGSVAPGNPWLGIMLPYTPLHHLLLSVLGFPVVATSGNLSDEPICIDETEARERLGGIADVFLVHNRPIVRPVDDSIVRIMAGRELVLRRSRGYAPLPVAVEAPLALRPPPPVLAVGAHLKSAIALSVGPQVFVSQHLGDLETDQAFGAFRRAIADFETLYRSTPALIAADAHPDYLSTKYARELVAQASLPAASGALPAAGAGPEHPAPRAAGNPEGPRFIAVQHHVAHILSCLAENELRPPVLGVAWDGTGYGPDGTVWGGEFFLVTETDCRRLAHLRRFRLPGGERAVKEPRRSALGVLHELFGAAAFQMRQLPPLQGLKEHELATLRSMLERGPNSPLTSSAGRLFDAVAALTGLRQQTRFEGQAAMELEFALEGSLTEETYQLRIPDRGWPRAASPADFRPVVLDWKPLMHGVIADVQARVAAGRIAARFHNTLTRMIVAVARRSGQERVVLSGGCFQNRYLTERTVRRLREEGFRPYWHQRVPPNDGGIALGQIIAAARAPQ